MLVVASTLTVTGGGGADEDPLLSLLLLPHWGDRGVDMSTATPPTSVMSEFVADSVTSTTLPPAATATTARMAEAPLGHDSVELGPNRSDVAAGGGITLANEAQSCHAGAAATDDDDELPAEAVVVPSDCPHDTILVLLTTLGGASATRRCSPTPLYVNGVPDSEKKCGSWKPPPPVHEGARHGAPDAKAALNIVLHDVAESGLAQHAARAAETTSVLSPAAPSA